MEKPKISRLFLEIYDIEVSKDFGTQATEKDLEETRDEKTSDIKIIVPLLEYTIIPSMRVFRLSFL